MGGSGPPGRGSAEVIGGFRSCTYLTASKLHFHCLRFLILRALVHVSRRYQNGSVEKQVLCNPPYIQ
jgi:hypothetical protein